MFFKNETSAPTILSLIRFIAHLKKKKKKTYLHCKNNSFFPFSLYLSLSLSFLEDYKKVHMDNFVNYLQKNKKGKNTQNTKK